MDQTNRKNISGAQFAQPADDFQIQSSSATVGFEQGDVMPPAAAYVTVDDQIQIGCSALFNGNNVVCTVRILRADGVVVPLVFVVGAGGNRVPSVKSFQLIEGYLLSVALVAQFATSDVNPCYAFAQLVRTPFTAAQSSQLLACGYVNNVIPIGWPFGKPQLPTEGQGFCTTTSGLGVGVPIAGADWTFTVPALMHVLVKSISAVLATSAAVANRNPKLVIDDGANVYASISAGSSQAATLTNRYTWMDGGPSPLSFDNAITAPLPSGLILSPGHRISSATTALQAGDQWSAIVQLGQIWLDLG